jgi:hypothetical protein
MRRRLFEELKQSLREAKLIQRGKLEPGRVFRLKQESKVVRVRGAWGYLSLNSRWCRWRGSNPHTLTSTRF